MQAIRESLVEVEGGSCDDGELLQERMWKKKNRRIYRIRFKTKL